jgi:dihydrofolate reductase
MGSLVLYMSMSLDGFIAGPGDDMDNPFGTQGHLLHKWLGDGGEGPSGFRPADEPSQRVFGEMMSTGAVITGRRTARSSSPMSETAPGRPGPRRAIAP